MSVFRKPNRQTAGYKGPLHMGLDRMTVEIGGDVKVSPPIPTAGLLELDSPDTEL